MSEAIWERRVAEWRASGLSMKRFVDGRDFSLGELRHWSCRVKTTATPGKPGADVRLARVIRAEEVTGAGPDVIIEKGGARVRVGLGVDVSTLRAVLSALEGPDSGART
jgi:transposase